MAVKWLRVSAAAGNAEAQNDLGYCLHEGLGVSKDRRHAFRWYLLGAKQGGLRAQFNVGLCYRDGDGVKASKPESPRMASGRRLAADMLRRVTVLTAMLQSVQTDSRSSLTSKT